MKKLTSLIAAGVLLLALLAVFAPSAQAEEICGEPTTVILYAGQTIDAGTVTVSNDGEHLYVTYITANDWLLSETHLHVANSVNEIPQANGNPIPGQFDYKDSYDPPVTEATYTIPLDDWTAGDPIVVAAHAVVVKLDEDGNVIDEETAWGDGEPFPGSNWATYFHYTIQDCDGGGGEPGETETAFAYGEEYATCFRDLDLDGDGKRDFSRWGWTNGVLVEGEYSFPIYAGAGQCDLEKGTLVGYLSINYTGSEATITYEMTETDDSGSPFTLLETHLYVGEEILPMKKGKYTVAPGQYPYKHDELDYVLSDSYTITDLEGEIYVVAHAVVTSEEPVTLTPDYSGSAGSGKQITYRHTIANNSKSKQTFMLRASSSQGWKATLSQSSITLGAGESASVAVTVAVPDGMGGESDLTTVTATSISDPAAAGSATNTTTGGSALFLPLVSSN